jgi:hypothetical protein
MEAWIAEEIAENILSAKARRPGRVSNCNRNGIESLQKDPH